MGGSVVLLSSPELAVPGESEVGPGSDAVGFGPLLDIPVVTEGLVVFVPVPLGDVPFVPVDTGVAVVLPVGDVPGAVVPEVVSPQVTPHPDVSPSVPRSVLSAEHAAMYGKTNALMTILLTNTSAQRSRLSGVEPTEPKL